MKQLTMRVHFVSHRIHGAYIDPLLTFMVVGMVTKRHHIVDDLHVRDHPVSEGGHNKMEEPMIHNWDFYFDGADIIVRVNNMLFKVGDALLSPIA